MLQLSQAAIDLIVREEVSGRTTYNKQYRNFEWPEGSSGPTVGIGYDCGYVTESECRADWGGIVDGKTIDALVSAIGHTGRAAQAWVRANKRSVSISYDDAMRQFSERELPKWIGRCGAALPNFAKLSPDCAGALVSLAYNRGPSFSKTGDRYKEMRAIKAAMRDERYADIPAQFRSMARLWTGGVHQRRLNEAALFERGLASAAAAPATVAAVATTPDMLPGPSNAPGTAGKPIGRIKAETAMDLAQSSRKWLLVRVLKWKACAVSGLAVFGLTPDNPTPDPDALMSAYDKSHSYVQTYGLWAALAVGVTTLGIVWLLRKHMVEDRMSGRYVPSKNGEAA